MTSNAIALDADRPAVPAVHTKPLLIEQIEDTAGFFALRSEWDELLEDSASKCIFLTWEWLYTWWQHLSSARTLRLLTFRSGGRLVAIAPLSERPAALSRLIPFRVVEFLGVGNVGSDYLDLIVRRGMEPVVVTELASYLERQKRVLEFRQVRTDSIIAKWARQEFLDRGWPIAESRVNVCPFIDLSGHSWESYRATLSANQRYNFQRRLKKLKSRFAMSLSTVSTELERREALGVLLALHDLRWRRRGERSNSFNSRPLLSFHEAFGQLAMERGWVRMYILRLDRVPVAAFYGFKFGTASYFYQSGFDPGYAKYSVGLVTMGLAIQAALAEGATEFDLLHGAEPYKFLWTGNRRDLLSLECFPPATSGEVCRKAMELRRIAGKVLHLCLPKPKVSQTNR